MNLFTKQKQTHRHRKQTWLPKVLGGGQERRKAGQRDGRRES